MPPKPFQIKVPDVEFERLHQKLDATTFPDELGSAGWDMGVPLSEIKRLAAYWRSGFDWRKQEAKLNTQFKQFTVSVSVEGYEDLELHYLHHISETPGAIPLLFIHGWPGSFIEATKIIPLLTRGDGNNPAFNVIAPSLPNFGFSSLVKKRGFGLNQYAEAIHNLMSTLGYEEYVIQGGDWGSFIARIMAQRYPTYTKAIHLNFIPMRFPMPWQNPLFFLQNLLPIPFSPARKAYLGSVLTYLTKGGGYMLQQSTRPQTLGYALHDSPVALLAWIYDKLHSWTDGYPWTDDEILTWVSIYLFSAAGPAASVRIYYETSEDGTLQECMSKPAPPGVKVGVAQFKEELMRYPLSWTSLLGNVVRATEYPQGGHFAAWEAPDLLVGDLKEFFGKSGQAYGVIEGKDGFD
ncbi:Alpha/Beta hydrolase protein [Aspergillus pseudoustus]|uniref:Alpha/Beta hydrolase protein n=1 Tax=Aspergillus pseudoustus TaxID=1810923 RepID=A0ABR4KKQ7_9EURO